MFKKENTVVNNLRCTFKGQTQVYLFSQQSANISPSYKLNYETTQPKLPITTPNYKNLFCQDSKLAAYCMQVLLYLKTL